MPSCRAWRRVWTIIADVAPPLLDRQAAPRETAGDSCPVRHVAGKEVLFSGFRITAGNPARAVGRRTEQSGTQRQRNGPIHGGGAAQVPQQQPVTDLNHGLHVGDHALTDLKRESGTVGREHRAGNHGFTHLPGSVTNILPSWPTVTSVRPSAAKATPRTGPA